MEMHQWPRLKDLTLQWQEPANGSVVSLNQAAAALVALINGAGQIPEVRHCVSRAACMPRPDHFY
jgi:hypothetical protein